MAEIVISDTTVTLRDTWTGRAAFRATTAVEALSSALKTPDLLRAQADSAYDSYVALCRAAIVSWGFDGSPDDPEAYEDLPMSAQRELFLTVLAATVAAIVPPSAEKKD